ncbi:asparaginase [Jannaschia aquimarina]|uniref:L-asparaginase II n=1 Tax=Jannaschia aquimarina TaxID=935700 RepID=A0A0D1EFN7_9RHOB|nr:asparaginase [Jannaschia aquimarina]KIT15696.1 L-asparaginase II [Jannaschia aquimarina]SNT39034.1 asparaginase [Jannaschia aquimarina]
MRDWPELVRVIRGDRVESVHRGAVVIAGPGGPVEVWGAPGAVIYPRSSCKMIQALPLVEAGLESDPRRLALACASHQGARVHVETASAWLDELGLGEPDLRCGSHMPYSEDAAADLIRAGEAPGQLHNNCSGKHSGFLALSKHLGADPDYIEIDHPVQRAVREAFEEVTGAESPGWAIDGCSAPNFACRLDGLALAMAAFAASGGDVRGRAMVALRDAMMAHPVLVAGEGRACTDLMRAAPGVAVKTGAEAVFVAIVPAQKLGIAVKIADGATRAAEAVIAALLVRLGLLDPQSDVARRLTHGPIRNRRGLVTGHYEVVL